jgi:hypothetical protein
MKSSRFYLLVIIVTTFTACKDSKEPDTLSVSPKNFTFTADDTKEEIAVIETNVSSWNSNVSDNWVEARKVGNNLHIKLQNYTNTQSLRHATITVTAGDAEPQTISIEQYAKEINTFSVNPTSLSFEANETGDKTVAVTTNAPSWDMTADASWVTLSKQNNTLKVTVATKNTQTTARTANILLTAGNAPDITITVTQGATNTLSVNPTSLSYQANETGEKSVTISTNASSWNATESASWISLSQNNNTLKVNVTSANTGSSPRSANIKITAGNAPEITLTVTQGAATTLSVNPTSLSYQANETGTKNITISTNATSWSATKTASWITISSSSNILHVNVTSANTSTSARSADIVIEAGDADAITLKVTQYGATNSDPSGNYTASGTPVLYSNSATTWTGTITPYTTSGNKYYAISNWGNDGITVRCNDKNSKITLDITTKVAENSTYNGYFRAGIIYDNVLIVINDYVHPVSYNSSTRVLNFSGTFEGYSVLVGVAAYKKSNGELDGFFTDFYRSLRLTLSSNSYAPQFDKEAAIGSSIAIRSSKIKNYTIKEMSLAEFKKNFSRSKNIK